MKISFIQFWTTLGIWVLALTGMNLYAQQDAFRVMTFNIRYDNPDDGENSWNDRKEIAYNVIHYHQPAIFGLQEALYSQVKDMENEFQGFARIGVGRDDGENKGEFCPLFYDTTQFSLRKSGTFWLSETPETPGKTGWDAACPRIVTWGYFYDYASQKSFYVFNTHLDHQGTIARLKSTELIIRKIKEMTNEKSWIPVILMGDFNSLRKSGPYQQLTYWDNPVKLHDAVSDSSARIMGPDYTYIGFDKNFREGLVIDYIFVNEMVDVHHHQIIDDHQQGKYPSDHLPVIGEISFRD